MMLGVVWGGQGSAFGRSLTRAQIEAKLSALEALAQQAIDAGDVPGLAVAVVYGDETLFPKGFGLREVGPDTVFRIASLSKPVTRTYPLRHFDRDVFLCFPDAEAPDNPSAIRFAVESGGKAAAVTVDALNANGLGTLDRPGE